MSVDQGTYKARRTNDHWVVGTSVTISIYAALLSIFSMMLFVLDMLQPPGKSSLAWAWMSFTIATLMISGLFAGAAADKIYKAIISR